MPNTAPRKRPSLLPSTLAVLGVGLVLFLIHGSMLPDTPQPGVGHSQSRLPSRSRIYLTVTAGVLLLVVMGAALYWSLSASSGQGLPVHNVQLFSEPGAFAATPRAVQTAIAAVLATPTGSFAPDNPTGPTDPDAYLQDALDFIQKNSMRKIDWETWRAKVLAEAGKPATRADTYFAIADALRMLGDHHSQLEVPQEYLRSQQYIYNGLIIIPPYPERYVSFLGNGPFPDLNMNIYSAGVRAGDLIEAIDGQPTESMGASEFYRDLYSGSHVRLTLSRKDVDTPVVVALEHPYVSRYRIPEGRRLKGNIGYIRLPGNGDAVTYGEYGEIVQEIIRQVDQPRACGWVVDLQENGGGFLTPMLVGIGPILGEGDVGGPVDKAGTHSTWSYRIGDSIYRHENGQPYKDGNVYIGTNRSKTIEPPFFYQLERPMPPVALLTDRWTASSAEGVVIAFRGRPNTRTFGESTYGVPTYNAVELLSDWANLLVTTGQEADRTGRVYGYNERIKPDQFVTPGSPADQGTDGDPVLAAGAKWLSDQPACPK